MPRPRTFTPNWSSPQANGLICWLAPQLAVVPSTGENAASFQFPLAIPNNILCTNNSWQYCDYGNENNVPLTGDFAGVVYGGHQGFSDYGYFDDIPFGRTVGVPVTLAAWFTAPLASASYPVLCSFGAVSGSSRLQIQVGLTNNFAPRFINTDGATMREHAGSTAMTAGAVYFGVLLARSTTDSQMYLFSADGFLETVSQTSSIDWAHAGRLACHCRWNGSAFGLNGEGSTLLDVKVWNRALSEREVWDLWRPTTRWQMYGVRPPARLRPSMIVVPDAYSEVSVATRLTHTGMSALTPDIVWASPTTGWQNEVAEIVGRAVPAATYDRLRRWDHAVVWRAGVPTNAHSGNPTAYVDCSTRVPLGGPTTPVPICNLTVAGWVELSALPSTGYCAPFYSYSANKNQLGLVNDGGTYKLYLSTTAYLGLPEARVAWTPNTGQMYHVAAVHQGTSRVDFYVDGSLIGTATPYQSPVWSNIAYIIFYIGYGYIGAVYSPSDQHMNGYVGPFAAWTRPLSGTEIAHLARGWEIGRPVKARTLAVSPMPLPRQAPVQIAVARGVGGGVVNAPVHTAVAERWLPGLVAAYVPAFTPHSGSGVVNLAYPYSKPQYENIFAHRSPKGTSRGPMIDYTGSYRTGLWRRRIAGGLPGGKADTNGTYVVWASWASTPSSGVVDPLIADGGSQSIFGLKNDVTNGVGLWWDKSDLSSSAHHPWTPTLNQVYCLAYVGRANGEGEFYVDGVRVGAFTLSGTKAQFKLVENIDYYYLGYSTTYHDGNIGAVGVWNRALSPEEIAAVSSRWDALLGKRRSARATIINPYAPVQTPAAASSTPGGLNHPVAERWRDQLRIAAVPIQTGRHRRMDNLLTMSIRAGTSGSRGTPRQPTFQGRAPLFDTATYGSLLVYRDLDWPPFPRGDNNQYNASHMVWVSFASLPGTDTARVFYSNSSVFSSSLVLENVGGTYYLSWQPTWASVYSTWRHAWTPELNRAYCIVMTMKNADVSAAAELKFYIDGAIVKTVNNFTTSVNYSYLNCSLGAGWYNAGSTTHDGGYGSAASWTRALSPGEVFDLSSRWDALLAPMALGKSIPGAHPGMRRGLIEELG